jgi:cytochrome P450
MRAKTRYDNGTLPNCFAKQLWDQREKHNLTDQEVGSLSGGLFGAGSDTSSATMTTFILAMTVFGDTVIPKAHEELDRVVGRKRSPTWTDEENLPYIRAVVKEAFRWRPVAVLGGTPHANTEDDYYNGYFIPKGSTILGNLWAVSSISPLYHYSFISIRLLHLPSNCACIFAAVSCLISVNLMLILDQS